MSGIALWDLCGVNRRCPALAALTTQTKTKDNVGGGIYNSSGRFNYLTALSRKSIENSHNNVHKYCLISYFFPINYHTESPIYFRISKIFLTMCHVCAKKNQRNDLEFRECYYLTCYTLYINVLGDNSGIFHCYHQFCQTTHWLRCRNALFLASIQAVLE